MAVLSWGKPLLEIAPYVNGALPATPTWAALPESKENSTKLTTSKGAKKEAKAEGGETIDIRYSKNGYMFETEIFVKKGDDKPIEDVDGVIVDNYAFRLTPEDDTLEGYLLEKAVVHVEEIWSSDEGKIWKYSFDGLKPASGAILKPYTKPVTP